MNKLEQWANLTVQETLSDKRFTDSVGCAYPEEDVKEFIRECRKQIMEKGRRFNIDKLAGDNFT